MASLDWLYVVLIVSAWILANSGVIYAYKNKLVNEKNPVTLPFLSFIWSLGVIVGVAVWSATAGSEYSNTIGKNYFKFGWTSMFFFNIRINTWWRYTIILNYQISRAILGSLLSNLFKPYLVSTVQNRILNKTINTDLSLKIVLAQASCTIFGYVSTLTDLFLFLSQIDISIISLVITLIVDALSTYSIMQHGSSIQSSEQLVKNVLEIEASETEPFLLRKRPDKKSDMWRSL